MRWSTPAAAVALAGAVALAAAVAGPLPVQSSGGAARVGGRVAGLPERPPSTSDLRQPRLKDIALQLVASAENSTLDWRKQYQYIEDIGDGRGYTGGTVGFCSGTGDMLAVVQAYAAAKPGNALARYLPALRSVNGTASHDGLGEAFVRDWRAAAADPAFRAAQDAERDAVYFRPALAKAQRDGLGALGQFSYFDAIVVHGPGGFGNIRAAALRRARPPAAGGDEKAYLGAFLDARTAVLRRHGSDTSRVETAQRRFLAAGNLGLAPPLRWSVYGDSYEIGA